ncbi:MAG: hypothetical protein U0165_03470 [Polyangiaceae bacterium]
MKASVFIAVVALLVSTSACGGDSKDKSSTTSPSATAITKAPEKTEPTATIQRRRSHPR